MMRTSIVWAPALFALFSLSLASCSSSERNDLKAPRVVTLTPEPDSAAVPIDTEVRVTFDVEIRVSSINAGSFTLRDVDTDTVVDAGRTYESGSNTAILRPSSGLAAGHRYEVVLEQTVSSERFGIELRDGRRAWQFTTASASRSEVDFEWLAVVFDARAAATFGADYLKTAPVEDLYDAAREVSREFAESDGGAVNVGFEEMLALALLGGVSVGGDLLDELYEAGICDGELRARWAAVPQAWQGSLLNRLLAATR